VTETHPELAESSSIPRWLAHPVVVPASVFLAVVAVHLWHLGTVPLSGTEGHRVIPGHLMLERGEWVLPHLFDQLYLRKPPGQPWTLAVFEALFGPSEWVWRLPSVLAAGALAAWVAALSRRWFGGVAGLASGVSCFTLVALWAQNRSADIDAANTLWTVATGLALIHVAVWRPATIGPALAWTAGIGVSFAAALLYKGPACLPVVVGALLSPALVGASDPEAAWRTSWRRGASWRWLLRLPVWGGLLLGFSGFGAWLLAVWWKLSERGDRDLRGVSEAGDRLLDVLQIPAAIGMLGQLWLFALPVSAVLLALPWLLRAWSGEAAAAIRAVVAALAVGGLVYVINGIYNPRYAYPLLPLLCPLAGAFAEAWRRGTFPEALRLRARQFGTVIAVVVPVVAMGFVVYEARMSPPGFPVWLWLSGLLGLVAGAVAVACWIRQRVAWAAALTAATFVALHFPLAHQKNNHRWDESYYHSAEILRSSLPPNTTLRYGEIVWHHPEVFFYLDRAVKHLPRGGPQPLTFAPQPLLLSRREWKRWQQAMPESFDEPWVLPQGDPAPVLVQYRGPSEPDAATTREPEESYENP